MAKEQQNPIATMRTYLDSGNIKGRFEEVLQGRTGAFLNSIVNVVRGSPQLHKVARDNPMSIVTAAMRAATLDLPIDPALGQAAIIPYGNSAHFQIMYKGVTQLCIRSAKYQTIHCSEVYQDELKSHNPITGEVQFHDPTTYKMRYKDKGKNMVGHYAYFKLVSGFEKGDYMTVVEVMEHARRYSRAYQYDLKQKKQASPWSTDPIPMGNKTVLLRLLRKYGVMSVEIQEAILADYDTFEARQAIAEKDIAEDMGSEPVDAEFEVQEAGKQKKEDEKKPKATKTSKKKPKATKTSKKKTSTKKEPDGTDKGEAEPPQAAYVCRKCGTTFDEPKLAGPDSTIKLCPEPRCGSLKIEATAKPTFMKD